LIIDAVNWWDKNLALHLADEIGDYFFLARPKGHDLSSHTAFAISLRRNFPKENKRKT
jgi:hypothetical protein